MKKLVAFFCGLMVLPAFAEIAPAYFYEDFALYEDVDGDVDVDDAAETVEAGTEDAPTVNMPVGPATRATAQRTAASRAMPATAASIKTTARSNNSRAVPSRNTVSRGTVSRTATTGTTRTTGAAPATRGVLTTRANSTTTAARNARSATGTAAVATNQAENSIVPISAPATSTRRVVTSGAASGATTARAGTLLQADTVNTTLYKGNSRPSSAVRARVPSISVSSGISTSTSVATASDNAALATEMEELTQMTDFCKAQYFGCMDNYCNVLNENQGRCSCSVNVKNYETTEQALAAATEELQEVAQKIQYIGLTADQVTTLFSQTEAELAMQSTTDTTQLKNSLNKIKKMIVDAESGRASVSTNTSGISLDLSGLLDFSFSSTGFDLAALFNNATNTSSIGNQRGEQLYKTASQRCKTTVLNSCQSQGVDISLITNAYDLEIDKQCLAYEVSLNQANTEMKQTVVNAKSVLERARLVVAQQKNEYDLRSCVNALDSCMQDDFVCGDDYENCLDPTGKYIVAGAVVPGSLPGIPGGGVTNTVPTGGLYATWNYGTSGANNAWHKTGNLGAYIDQYIKTNYTGSTTSNIDKMAEFLQAKIGYIDNNGKPQGMCSYVFNSCQDVTFTKNGAKLTYNSANDVVKMYMQRVLTQIKVAQDEVLAEYAESCIGDVAACLAQNNSSASYFGANYYNYATTNGVVTDVAIRACRAYIDTCMNVTGNDSRTDDVYQWLDGAVGSRNQEAKQNCSGTWNANGTCTCSSGTWNSDTLKCEK